LRASPAAKNAAKHHGKQNDKDHECEEPDGKDEKILRPESDTEEDKLTLQYIKEKERRVIYFNERKRKKNNEINNTEPGSQVIQFSFGLFRIDKVPVAITGNGGYRIPERFLVYYFSGFCHLYFLIPAESGFAALAESTATGSST
jgi:hypothetical protein